VQGGKSASRGAWVGKNGIIQEICPASPSTRRKWSVFAGVGDAPGKGNDLWLEETEFGASSTRPPWVYGPDGRAARVRLRVASVGSHIAEYFRTEGRQTQDGLLFVYYHLRVRAGPLRLSTLLGRMPSAVGVPTRTLADGRGDCKSASPPRWVTRSLLQAVYVPR